MTNGWVYAVYLGKDGGFGERPDAYLNLARRRESYPLLGCHGAKEALLYLSFGWEPPAAQIEGAQVHEDYETPYEEAERKCPTVEFTARHLEDPSSGGYRGSGPGSGGKWRLPQWVTFSFS